MKRANMPGTSAPAVLSMMAVARKVPLRVSIVGLMRAIVASNSAPGAESTSTEAA